jgi:hypothetical protein
MRSEIVGNSGDGSNVNEAVGGFSAFLASLILCASQVSSYVLRLVHRYVVCNMTNETSALVSGVLLNFTSQ